MKQSLCCGVPEGQACAYQLLATHQAELGAQPDALSSPAVEARSWEQMGSSCCHYASLPASLDFITAKPVQANFSGAGFGAQNEGFSAWEGRQILRHPPAQELLDAVWTRRDKHWKLNKMSKDLLASVETHSSVNLKSLSSYPWLWMCSILHRWLSGQVDGPVSQMNNLVRNYMPSFINLKKKKSLAREGTESELKNLKPHPSY